MTGKVFVGRCTYDYNRKRTDPTMIGFENVVVLTKTTRNKKEYFNLSPYYLRDPRGYLMENIWQFSKVYPRVSEIHTCYPHSDRVIWSHNQETHYKDDKITPEYFRWREKGFSNPEPVRYPNGYKGKKEALFSLSFAEPNMTPGEIKASALNYIEARKKIYVPLYCELVKKEAVFQKLQKKLSQGTNLLIIEVDGPHYEDLKYYQEKYSVEEDFILNKGGGIMEATERNIKIMLNDEKNSFGHGYCLSMALLEQDRKWNQ